VLPAVAEEPQPEIEPLPGAADRAQRAAEYGEIEKDDGVGRPQPDVDDIVGSEVAVDDPGIPRDEFALDLRLLLSRKRYEAGLPEYFVQFDYRQADDLAQFECQRRFSRSSGTDDQHALHGYAGICRARRGQKNGAARQD
jgi:hypothetical protein